MWTHLYFGVKKHVALCGKCYHLDTFNVWLLWNGINSLLNTILKIETIFRNFQTSIFGYVGRYLQKRGLPCMYSTNSSINNLIAHGFLI